MGVENKERVLPIPEPFYTIGHKRKVNNHFYPLLPFNPVWLSQDMLPDKADGKKNYTGYKKIHLYDQVCIEGHGNTLFQIMNFTSSGIIRSDYLSYIPQGTIGY